MLNESDVTQGYTDFSKQMWLYCNHAIRN